jgi:hypothetical protein
MMNGFVKFGNALCGDGSKPVLSGAEGTRPARAQLGSECYRTRWTMERRT